MPESRTVLTLVVLGAVIAGLKQRLLSFLFLTAQRLAAAAQAADEPPVLHPVQLFFRHFCNYHDLLLSRARLLNSCQLLLQFSFPDAMVCFLRACWGGGGVPRQRSELRFARAARV